MNGWMDGWMVWQPETLFGCVPGPLFNHGG